MKRLEMKKTILTTLTIIVTIQLVAQPLRRVDPQKVGLDPQKLTYADQVIREAIDKKEIPGAVLAVVRNGKMAYLKAYGNRQVYPEVLPMEENTIFDLASVSKPVSTAISTLILVEQGKLSLRDRVNIYIPEFQGSIRVVDLLTHTSGLPSYAPVDSLKEKYGYPSPDGLIDYISTCRRDFVPGKGFQYSCLNYITLQRIIEKVSGQNLRDFAKKHIFDVLGMKDTDYNPAQSFLSRCAATEKQKDGSVLLGVVHDPLARIMNGGISGNAGVFSTADDLAILAAALLNGGVYNHKRILGPLTVKMMTAIPAELEKFGRSPGWDISSSYSSIKGDLFSLSAYGHSGYTGTSFVVDPKSNTAVILLTNRVHPDDAGAIIRLRILVANIIAGSILK